MSYVVQKAVAERVVGKIGEVSALLRKAILMNMAVRANDDGTGIYASKLKIAVWLETTERSVRRAVDTLLDDGLLIEVGDRTMPNGAILKDYTISLDALAELPLSQETFEEERSKERKRKKRGADKASASPNSDEASGKGGQGVSPQADKASGNSDEASADKVHNSSSSLRSEEEGAAPAEDLFGAKAKPKASTSKPKPIEPHAMHEDWEPNEETRQYARKLGFADWEIDAAAVECRDYWLDNPKTKRPGWERTFQRSLRGLVDDRARRAKLKHVRPGAQIVSPKPVSAAEQRRRMQEFEDFGTWDARWGPKPQQEARAA